MTPQAQRRTASTARERANRKYRDEVWTPLTLRPNAVSTTRHDDIARLIRGEHGRVLDFGCGSGQLVIALSDSFETLVGVDSSDARIRLASTTLGERYAERRDRISFQCVDPVEPLPFPDGSFDVVVASAVLEAVPDVFFSLDEIARVCRPGGALLVSVANTCYIKHVPGMLMGRVPVTWSPTRDMAVWREQGWDGGCLRHFCKGILGDLLEHTGFVPEQWSGSGVLAKFRRWHLNLCGGLTVRARRVTLPR